MQRNRSRGVLVSGLVAVVILAGVLGAVAIRIKAERDRLAEEASKLEERGVLLQKKVREEKARADTMRMQATRLEAERGKLGAALGSLREENAALAGEREALRGEQERLQSVVRRLSAGLDESRREQQDRAEALAQKVGKLEKALQEARDEARVLALDLESEAVRRERCETDNAELCTVVDDLIRKYEDKGIVQALLQREPLTQIRKVEVERSVQDYRQRLSEHVVEAERAACETEGGGDAAER